MAEQMIGKKVGNFRITGFLGAGAMGAVYVGEHSVLRHKVAIKVMRSDLLHSKIAEQAVKRFVAEAKALTEIPDTTHIIRLHDFGQLDGGHLYYVMEYLEGHDLQQELDERRSLSPAQALPYLRQICLGLQAAHDSQIIHRDLKPANIFVLQGAPLRLKLLDFGIAKRLGTAHPMTQAGMGSPLYAAPEQILAEQDKIGPQTDIYSLGVIAYRMLSGEMPWQVNDSAHPVAVMMLPLETPPRPLHDHVPAAPLGVSKVVDQCLAKDPASRPASATAFCQAFEDAVRSEPSIAATPLAGQPPSLVGELSASPGPDARVPSTTLGGSVGELKADETITRLRLFKPALAFLGILAIALGVMLYRRASDRSDRAALAPAPRPEGSRMAAPDSGSRLQRASTVSPDASRERGARVAVKKAGKRAAPPAKPKAPEKAAPEDEKKDSATWIREPDFEKKKQKSRRQK